MDKAIARDAAPMTYLAVCPLDDPPAWVMSTPLSGDELASLAEASSGKRRREITVSRRLIRRLLSRQPELSRTVVDWTGAGPHCTGRQSRIGLSLAHSRHHAAAALSGGGAVGIDIESLAAPRRWRRIMAGVFCARDADWISSCPPETFESSGLRRFLAVWTAREAYAKLCGESIFDVLSHPALREVPPGETPDGTEALAEVAVTDQWVVAVCRRLQSQLPGCMIRAEHEGEGFTPFTADFVFQVGDCN